MQIFKFGCFGGSSVNVSGKVSSSRENTRSTNQTAKYQVHVSARQQRQTEGMSKLMDSAKGSMKDDLRKINTVLGSLTALWRMLKSKNSGSFDMLSKDGSSWFAKRLVKV